MEKIGDRLSSARPGWKGTGSFPMQDRRLWGKAFEASINGAVRTEEEVGSEIAAMAVAKTDFCI